MWKKLFDLSAKRNLFDIVLFYFVYGVIGAILCGWGTSIISKIVGVSTVEQAKHLAMRVAPLLAGVYAFFISLALLMLKRINKDIMAVSVAILGTFACSALGLLYGFIPVAVLSAFAPDCSELQAEN